MEHGVRLRRALWSAVIVLAFIGVAVAVRRIVYLGPILANGYSRPALAHGSRGAQFVALDEVFARHAVLTMIHIVPGLLFMILGPFQFSKSIRTRHLQWHRWNGRILVTCGLIIGISALLMSFTMQSIGGVNQAAATILFALFFLFALSKAVWHISRREIVRHRQWMIRAYAIGLAVATIRPIIGIFFATSPLSGLTPTQFFGTAFWIGFVLHLMAAEAWIRSTMPREATPSLPSRFASSL
jgi:uncharacterized membrane protein